MPDTSDRAVSDPSDDLLAMAEDAARVARRVATADLPFTVGVYGAWGEGKTSFAKLVAHDLERQPGWRGARFIEFSAWPFVTADAVWRALLETIARDVYNMPVNQADPPHQPVRARLRRLLLTEVLATGTDPAEVDRQALERLLADFPEADREPLRTVLAARPDIDAPALDQLLAQRTEAQRSAVEAFVTAPTEAQRRAFEQLMARLGRSTALTSRGAEDADTARKLSLLAGVVLDVAATAASPLSSVRGLLGLKDDAAAKAARTAETSVTSVEEIRQGVRDLFQAASTPRTVVLIDDLDRCLPEVAFDILETIKVFLAESAATEARCLFIVAVDQEVLTRGLNVRLGGDTEAHRLEARTYLEKVVQFGVSVADLRASTSERLIAGRFPEWVGAVDLIDLATSSNPRRLKQHCELLTFGYERVQEQRG
ncbi:P-loop NTPase fold protein [Actinoplanes sp. NPDC048967]|uniref:KAP family P-loop NTPase fold protein n=1 Tax=Actinoplanes sp. NPDC048967 TaxID=3155269 RepID=UPI003407BE96